MGKSIPFYCEVSERVYRASLFLSSVMKGRRFGRQNCCLEYNVDANKRRHAIVVDDHKAVANFTDCLVTEKFLLHKAR